MAAPQSQKGETKAESPERGPDRSLGNRVQRMLKELVSVTMLFIDNRTAGPGAVYNIHHFHQGGYTVKESENGR